MQVITPKRSSNVKSVRYNEATKVLTVQFSSGAYDYFDVPPDKWQQLVALNEADGSVGTWVSANIIKQHQFRRSEPGVA